MNLIPGYNTMLDAHNPARLTIEQFGAWWRPLNKGEDVAHPAIGVARTALLAAARESGKGTT